MLIHLICMYFITQKYPYTNSMEEEFSSILMRSLTFLEQQFIKNWPLFFLPCILTFISIACYRKQKNQVLVRWPLVDFLPSLLQNVHRVHEWTVEASTTFVDGTIVGKGPLSSLSGVMMFTCNPKIVEHILKTNFSNYPKGSDFMETFDLIGEGIFNVDFDEWVAQRRMAHNIFTSKEFRSFVANVSRNVVENSLLPLLSHVSQNGLVVNLEDVFMRFTFDSVFSVIFGRNLNYLSLDFPNNEFANAVDVGTEATFFRNVTPIFFWKFLRFLNVGKERKLAEAKKTIDNFLSIYISSKREEVLQGAEANDLIGIYMTTSQKGKDFLSNNGTSDDYKFFRDTALNFLFAGRDSTGSSLTWLFWLVSKNPRVEAKILEELRSIVMEKDENGKGLRVFDSKDLKGLVYLHAALCEGLRLYPPLPMNRKVALNDDVLPNGTLLKAGTKILISKYAMARMEWVWGKDCFEFKPERWIDEDGKLSREPLSKFFVFSAGPRTCVGKDMSFVQMKSVVAAMLFNFQVEVVEGHEMKLKPSVGIPTKNGFLVKIKKRVV